LAHVMAEVIAPENRACIRFDDHGLDGGRPDVQTNEIRDAGFCFRRVDR
jgi:hypothetical protein